MDATTCTACGRKLNPKRTTWLNVRADGKFTSRPVEGAAVAPFGFDCAPQHDQANFLSLAELQAAMAKAQE